MRNPNAVMTGVFLIGVALLAFYLTARLSTFTTIGLGSGFLPRALASLQLVFGAVLVAIGLFRTGEPIEPWPLRPWAVLLSIGFFAVTIERMGLMIAVVGLVLIASAGNKDTKLRESVPLAIGAAAFCWLVFVKALGLTIPLWPADLWGG